MVNVKHTIANSCCFGCNHFHQLALKLHFISLRAWNWIVINRIPSCVYTKCAKWVWSNLFSLVGAEWDSVAENTCIIQKQLRVYKDWFYMSLETRNLLTQHLLLSSWREISWNFRSTRIQRLRGSRTTENGRTPDLRRRVLKINAEYLFILWCS